MRAVNSMLIMLNQSVRNVLNHNQEHDFQLSNEIMEKYMAKSIVKSILWSFCGDCDIENLNKFNKKIQQKIASATRNRTSFKVQINQEANLIDLSINVENGEWMDSSNEVIL